MIWQNLSFIMISSVSIFLTYFHSNSDYTVCKSPECIEQGRLMGSYMNPKMDPCEDFFEYSCSRWEKENPIPSYTYSYGWTNLYKLRDEFKGKIKEIMESNLDNFPEMLKLTQKFYNSCMNFSPLKDTGVEDFANQQFDVPGITYLSMYFITVTLQISKPYESDRINLAPLTRSYKFSKKDEIDQISKLWPYGYPNSPLTKNEIESIIDFEESLAHLTSVEKIISEYKFDTLEELSNSTIDWKEFFRIYFNGTGVNLDWSKQLIHLHDADFFSKIGKFLKNTDKNLIVNVAKWRILYGPHTNKNEFDAKYLKIYSSSPEERLKICTDLTWVNFGSAIMNAYVQKYIPSSNKLKLNNMLNRIQNSFKLLIQNSELISEETKTLWIQKTDHVESLIGYPDWILNSTQLAQFYENLELTNSSNFYYSLKDVTNWHNVKNIEKFNTTLDFDIRKMIWLIVVQLDYNFPFNGGNFIVVPAGFLHYPYYGMPLEVLNYAGIGFVLAHEFVHFISENKIPPANETCLIEQYDQYIAEPIDGLKINGAFTYNENYADNGGIQIAFKAYQDYLVDERQGVEEERLPGLEHLNSDQLFFLAYAQSMCAAYTREEMKKVLVSDKHSPEEFRIKGPFNNFKEFSQVWNCPKPKNPCLIW